MVLNRGPDGLLVDDVFFLNAGLNRVDTSVLAFVFSSNIQNFVKIDVSKNGS